MALLQEVVEALQRGTVDSKESLNRVKHDAARRHKANRVPSDAEVWAALPEGDKERFRVLLRTKGTRTASGVAIVAVQTSPAWCPHGTCTYCPGGPPTQSAKSYTGFEPAALRAGRHGHDPYAQVADRVKQLRAIGHQTDKVDLILMGGTLTARDLDYQEWFAKRCYDAFNDDGVPSTNRLGTPGALTLDEAQARNEGAASRVIGLTVETKPDWARQEHIDIVLGMGATRIELGVQTTFDEVLAAVHRGHDSRDAIQATRLAKDAGLKVCFHIMPGLPGNTPERDAESFRRIFSESDWRPDMIKIYPTLVLPGTPLFEDWRQGRYKPYTTQQAAAVIAEAKRHVPPWIRIQRVDRDIPTTLLAAGVDKSNLRQIALAELESKYHRRCRCVRCREIGYRPRSTSEPELVRRTYEASGGREYFLGLEDLEADALHAYLRLRVPAQPHRPELRDVSHAMIREVKVVGRVAALGAHGGEGVQHQGLGRRLVEEAARITFDELGLDRLFVLAGVGVKAYYRKLGFVDDGIYLSRGAVTGAWWLA